MAFVRNALRLRWFIPVIILFVGSYCTLRFWLPRHWLTVHVDVDATHESVLDGGNGDEDVF